MIWNHQQVAELLHRVGCTGHFVFFPALQFDDTVILQDRMDKSSRVRDQNLPYFEESCNKHMVLINNL